MSEIIIALGAGGVFGLGFWYGYTTAIDSELTRFYNKLYTKKYGHSK